MTAAQETGWPPELKLVRHPKTKAWWIKGDGARGTSVWHGPYDTKAEAEDDRRGLLRGYVASGLWYELQEELENGE